MGDRRKGDRREGIQNKHLNISFQSFITIVVFVLAIIAVVSTWIFVGNAKYKEGYDKGYADSLSQWEQVYSYYDVNDDFDDDIDFVEEELNDTIVENELSLNVIENVVE